ncbi:MAG: PHP domain-containing protein, partial [Planctomycetota bacterium]
MQLKDIKAELHAHTTASDGKWSIHDLAIVAKDRGFHTVAITDHSASSAIANGLSAERLNKHIDAIHQANDEIDGITLLAGSEVDILSDGELDYDDELLARLDLVVASPHAALTQDSAKATRRLIQAIESPYVHIIGHPTGRLINRREGLSPDMTAIIEAAAATGTALEINANDWRLDLRDTHAHAAIEAGVLLAINTDAHSPDHLDHLPYGVLTAQRAWAEKKHIVNCMTH